MNKNRMYRAAIYVRLSKEDGDSFSFGKNMLYLGSNIFWGMMIWIKRRLANLLKNLEKIII